MQTATKSRTESRIYAGIHDRFSTYAGLALGRDVGDLVAARFLAD